MLVHLHHYPLILRANFANCVKCIGAKSKQFTLHCLNTACAHCFSCKNEILAPSGLRLSIAFNVCRSRGPAVCVDWAKAVHRRCIFAQEENAGMRGHGILGAAGRRAGGLYCGAAGFPHLLLLEEEQTVPLSVPLKQKILVIPPLFCCYHLDFCPCLPSRLEYKYSRLVMSANKECEMPGTDSCAVMEGENEGDMEDEVVYTKPSLLGKLKAIASKVSATSTYVPAAAKVLRNKSGFFFHSRATERTSSTCSWTHHTRKLWCGVKKEVK